MKHISLFSGIGGPDLAAQWMGWENVASCEVAEIPNKVLSFYWPKALHHRNIYDTNFTIHRGKCDVLSGGFPCQPYSQAGKRKGKEDSRHLWPEMLRAIREIQPTWVVGENVFGIVNWSDGLVFEEVQLELEAEGYEVQSYVLPAAGVGAPHQRYRVWFVAYSKRNHDFRTQSRSIGEAQAVAREYRKKYGSARKFSRANRWHNEGCETKQHASTYSHSDGYQYRGLRQNRPSQGKGAFERYKREWIRSEFGRAGDTGDFTNSKNDRPATKPRGCRTWSGGWFLSKEQQSRRQPFGGCSNDSVERYLGTCHTWDRRAAWEDFPTQRPVCSGNDGLPSQLDGITFSKHRGESIKAYGNAIVPQVIYQIFQAIQEYESNIRQ